MKTSKEMQLKIIDKMRENVESDRPFYEDLEYTALGTTWVDEEGCIRMDDVEYRIKPQTITINGVEIPKPLTKEDLTVIAEAHGNDDVFYPCPNRDMFMDVDVYGALRSISKFSIVYSDVGDAIEASKLLFGIKD